MFNIYICNTYLGDNIYDIKLKGVKKELIKKYNLVEKGAMKEYWLNNVLVTNNQQRLDYKYVIDNKIEYIKDKNILIQDYQEEECIPFQFYNTDIEEEFFYYQNSIDGVEINLREYNDYSVLFFRTEVLNNFNKLNNFYI